MKIPNNWISSKTGREVSAFYENVDDFSNLPQDKIKSICAFCYCDGKFVVVNNESQWEPVAGHVEPNETVDDALIREVQEESNMKVLKFFPVGYQYINGQDIYQTRYFCVVEPYGPFVADPDGDVTEIKLVEPSTLIEYIRWGESAKYITERCLEIIDRESL